MPIAGMSFAGCEIKNDTQVNMYISRKVDWPLIAKGAAVIGGVVALVSGVGGVYGLSILGVAAGEGAAATATIIAGIAMTADNVWKIVGVTGAAVGLFGGLVGFTPAETNQLRHDLAIAEDGTDVIVHTNKSIMQIIEGNSDEDIAKAMNMTEDQVRQMKRSITDHKYGAELIRPGKSFKFDTGMYSTWKAHVITENLEEGVADVWTAFWYGTYSHYKASTLWKDLSVKKLPISIHKAA